MRTLVAAAEPPRRPAVTVSGSSKNSRITILGGTTDTVLAFLGAAGVAVSPWQAVVIRQAYAVRLNARLLHCPLR